MNEIESVIFPSDVTQIETQGTKTKCASNAAKELLKNGILVETKKGLVCMSLKDALNKGVGGHNLSVEDFQTVATKLLFQEPEETAVAESAAAWTDSSLKEGHKPIKKTNTNKIPIVSIVPVSDICNSSQVNLDEFKDVEDSLVDFSSLEYCSLDKVEAESRESKRVAQRSTLKVDEISKKPLVNKRSLIIKNNIKPVISVQSLVANKNETKPKSSGSGSVLINPGGQYNSSGLLQESYMSCEETSDNSEVTLVIIDKADNKPVKKRGGWPKGRKRKPEIKHEIRPPKAPATGYVIFLNEKRKDYRDMPFTEVTKLLGNEWSKLTLQEKKVYLDQAEVEKKRYREELKAYRQSDAYQSYLHKKRLKRLQGHGTEESDMDATDEIDEEDNEELYCRLCDQWFHSLHNKKEHLYGRQHLQSIAGRYTSDPDWCNPNMSSTSLDESSLDGSSYLKANKEHCCNKNKDSFNMDEVIVRFMVVNKEREEERKVLRKKLEESKTRNQVMSQELQKLNEKVDSLTCMMESERTTQILLEQRLFNLLNVPTLFYLPEPLSEDNN